MIWKRVDMARLLARLVVIALLPSLFGCDGKTDQQAESTAPFEGVEIQIAVPAGMGFDSRLQSVIAEWEARTNGTAKLVEYELHPGQAVAVPSGSVLSIVPLNTVSHRIVEGQSVVAQYDAIPASQQSDAWLQWHDVFKGLRENVGSAGGQASIVPLSCDTLVCVFRQDLLSKAKLEPPRTWDEYDRLVQQLDQWAPSLVAAEPWSDDFRVTMFLARSVSYARHPDNYSVFFDIRSGRPLIDSPGFQIGLAESVAAIKRLPKACLTMSPSDCVREVVEGRAAIAIGIPSLEPASADSAKRDAKQDHVVGSCRLPGSRRVFNHSTSGWEELPRGQVNHVPLVGFSGFAAVVENTATHTQAAAARNMLRTISIEGAPLPREAVGLVRKSQMNRIANLLAASETRLHPQEIQLYLNAVSESLNDTRLVTEIPVAGADRFKLSLREMLDQAIGDESVSVPEQLDQQVKAWTSLVSEVGQEVVRRSYRFSLGMR